MATWKLIVFVAIVSLAAAKRYEGELEALKLRHFLTNNLGSTESLSEKFNAVESASEKFDNSHFRLPNNTRPNHYVLRIGTEIHSGNFSFDGVVRINISVLETSNTITLHSRNHNIQQVLLFNPDGTNFPTAISYVMDAEREFLIITSAQTLPEGRDFTLAITFSASLEEFQNRGFIRLSTVDSETNVTNWLATTHFHPINSRHGYPCYDEVRYRATYQLSLYHHASYQAVSNTPITSVTVDNNGYATTLFEQTPTLPPYVIGWTVSTFPFVNVTDGDVLFRIFARPEAIEAGQLDNALEVGVDMLRTMENIFNISYPLAQSSMLAAPQLGADGAHNWGLLSFREDIIIAVDDNRIAQDFRENRLGHEYSVS